MTFVNEINTARASARKIVRRVSTSVIGNENAGIPTEPTPRGNQDTNGILVFIKRTLQGAPHGNSPLEVEMKSRLNALPELASETTENPAQPSTLGSQGSERSQKIVERVVHQGVLASELIVTGMLLIAIAIGGSVAMVLSACLSIPRDLIHRLLSIIIPTSQEENMSRSGRDAKTDSSPNSSSRNPQKARSRGSLKKRKGKNGKLPSSSSTTNEDQPTKATTTGAAI
jgi:hypothetical protein